MLVQADGVSVAVGGITLLAPASVHARAGEVVAVRGGNGSGKTTLLRVIAGAVPATSGSVSVASSPVDQRDAAFRRRVASLIGLPPLARNLTLGEHLRLVGLSWGGSGGESDTRASELLASLDLAALASRFPHELSSGQTQLFALALTLVRPSEVLLLDEPEQRLDADRLALVRDRIRRAAAEGCAVVMATHSDWLAGEVAQRTVTLSPAHG